MFFFLSHRYWRRKVGNANIFFFSIFFLLHILFFLSLNVAFAICGYLLNVGVFFFVLFFALTSVKRKDVLCFAVFQEVAPRTSKRRA